MASHSDRVPPIGFLVFPLGVLLGLGVAGWNHWQSVKDAATRSYVYSICAAVEHFHGEHGTYPEVLRDLGSSQFDADAGIRLEDIDYEHSHTGYSVSYRGSSGRVIGCP